MAIDTYNPSDHPERIISTTAVEFGCTRHVVPTLHVMQYDNSIPVIAVKLYKNGEEFAVPTQITDIMVRWGKPDKTFVIKSILGLSSDRKTAYFEVDDQMTLLDGKSTPILELKINSVSRGGSSGMPFIIDRNPVQREDIESTSYYQDLATYVNRALEAAERAEAAALTVTSAQD